MYLVVYLSCRPSQSNPSRQRTWCSSALARIRVDGLDAKSVANYYTAIFSQQFILVFVFKFSLSTLLFEEALVIAFSYLHVKLQQGSKRIQLFYRINILF